MPIEAPTYTSAMLENKRDMCRLRQNLSGKKWEMEVQYSKEQISFFRHPSFPENVFCWNPNLGTIPQVGSHWLVEVTVRFNKKKNAYGFVVAHAEPLGVQNLAHAKAGHPRNSGFPHE